MLRRFSFTLAFIAAATCFAAPIALESRLEPLVDDYLIAKMSGTTLEMHQPVRREVVITHDEQWEGNISAYHVVFQDGDLYKMYYRASSFPKPGSPIRGHGTFLCYAESKDGIQWTKPNLGLIEFQGNKNNNIIMTSVEATAFAPFLDTNPNCKPEEKYKALAIASRSKGLRVFASPDGLRWKPIVEQMVILKSTPENEVEFDSLNLAFWDNERKCYVAYFRKYRPLEKRLPNLGGRVRDILTATSSDFINWSESQWLKYPGAREEELYTNGIMPYYRAPQLRVGVAMRYMPARMSLVPIDPKVPYMNGCTDAVLMTSRDGLTFKRSAEAFIRPGLSKGNWVTRNTLPAWGIVETISTETYEKIPELSMYATEGYYEGNAARLRRFSLRVDGFGSVHAGSTDGEMMTKPITFTGKTLTMNYATSAAGSIRVEIQDLTGKPIPGFTLEESKLHFGDDLAQVVSWKSGSDVSALASQQVRLRFVMNDADLYAIQFK